MVHPSESFFNFKSGKVSFAHHLLRSNEVILRFGVEHNSDIAVHCATFQTDKATEMGVMNEKYFARFDFKVSFGWISCVAPDLKPAPINSFPQAIYSTALHMAYIDDCMEIIR